ncbi:MAG: glycosyltransferase family 2 protein [Rhizobiaceae bacterium]|nr:MAG: glycosyltransferase family 2 protein [Rhizobiaceae bacterium]CAG1015998.1 Putative glycosyltransferase EpsH [Rhizobiaceae bacterium]
MKIFLPFVRRRAPDAKVTICIPAYMAEAFVERTLRCAREQTLRDIVIAISVDASSDATAAICRRHAAEDERIVVHVQAERLGWAGNVNFLLERVQTPFFFLYFHDDVVKPEYTARLLTRLEREPAAGSIHCDMGHFGASEHVSQSREYRGSASARLLTFLLAPDRGSPLRSLTRSQYLDVLRLPTDAPGGFWANEPYLMRLLAAAPALNLHESLYLRWDKRTGGLTDGWRSLTAEQELAGLKANAATSVGIIQDAVASAKEKRTLLHALATIMMMRVRGIERSRGRRLVDTPSELDPALGSIEPAPDLSPYGTEMAEWMQRRLAALKSEDRRRPHQ